MAAILDVLPTRIRFSTAVGASATRNVLIRNISTAEQSFEVKLPGPPFFIARGAERLGRPVRLAPDETVSLQVALDRDALPCDDRPACDVMEFNIELCRPVFLDLLAASEDLPADAAQQLIDARRTVALPAAVPFQDILRDYGLAAPEIQASTLSSPSSAVGQPLPSLAVQPIAASEVEVEQTRRRQPLQSPAVQPMPAPEVDVAQPRRQLAARPVPVGGANQAGAAALAAFLGEAPAASALRGGLPAAAAVRRPSPAGGGAQAARAVRRQGSDDSPPDTPPRTPSHNGDFDDDRPPTPSPECANEYGGAQRAAAEAEAFPLPVGRRGPLPSRISPSPRNQAPFGSASEELPTAPPSLPPPIPPVRVSRSGSGSLAPASSAPLPPERVRGMPPLDATRLPAGRQVAAACRSLPPPAPSGSAAPDDYFFLEGVGWCDLYGRPVGKELGNDSGTEASKRPPRGAAAPTKSGPRARSKPPREGVAGGGSQARQGASAYRREPQVSTRQREMNWEELSRGGI